MTDGAPEAYSGRKERIVARGNGHLEWESSKDEKFAENWWTEHGFSWKLTKRFISKSVYAVTKDGVTVNYEIPNEARMNIRKYMEGPAGFTHYWEMYLQCMMLRKEAEEKGIK